MFLKKLLWMKINGSNYNYFKLDRSMNTLVYFKLWLGGSQCLCEARWGSKFRGAFQNGWVFASLSNRSVTIGGSRGRAPPLRVPILSFWHTKFSKRNHLGSPHPLLRGPRPPTGNPGSATGYFERDATLWNINFKSNFSSLQIVTLGCANVLP